MKIIRSYKYLTSLVNILTYIVKNNKHASIDFANNLDLCIDNLVIFPKMYRESIYYTNNNYRDLIYKGYTVIYKINATTIEIIDIFNQNKPQ